MMTKRKESDVSNISPVDSSQVRAILAARSVSEIILNDPALREAVETEYRQGSSVRTIARNLPYGLREPSFSVAVKAVSFALRDILMPEEQAELVKEHYDNSVARNIAEGVFIENGLKGARKRDMKNVPKDELREMARRGTVAKGQTPWSAEEREWALSHMEEFRSPYGINCHALAAELNNRFHDGEQIRNRNIKNTINYYLKKSLPVDKV